MDCKQKNAEMVGIVQTRVTDWEMAIKIAF
jgi:hypothetical protein